MKINQKLTATVLIIVTIAIMFGLHPTFQAETAEAHVPWGLTCTIMASHHRLLTPRYFTNTIYTGHRRTVNTNCVACSGDPPSTHTQEQVKSEHRSRTTTQHRFDSTWLWFYCHEHEAVLSTTYYWVTLHCSGS